MELSTTNTVTSLQLFEQICLRTGYNNTEETFALFGVHVVNTLTVKSNFELAAPTLKTTKNTDIHDLTYNMCLSVVGTIVKETLTLSQDVNYLFYGHKAVETIQRLHTCTPQEFSSPNTIDSLEFTDLINNARKEHGITKVLLHKSVLQKIDTAIEFNINHPTYVSDLVLVTEESTYIDQRNNQRRKIIMSPDFALALGMTYEQHIRHTVQSEMNRLNKLIAATPTTVPPPLPTLTNLQPVQPNVDFGTYITVEEANKMSGYDIDESALLRNSAIHNLQPVIVSDGEKSVPTYHSTVYVATHNIPVETWAPRQRMIL